jgi:hypothetical protein
MSKISRGQKIVVSPVDFPQLLKKGRDEKCFFVIKAKVTDLPNRDDFHSTVDGSFILEVLEMEYVGGYKSAQTSREGLHAMGYPAPMHPR